MKLLLLVLALCLIDASAPTMTITAPAMYTHNSYRGRPDLGLAVAIDKAGTGHGHFDANRLFAVLAGKNADKERNHLERLYGRGKFHAFMQTWTFSGRDLEQLLRDNRVTLPSSPRVSPDDGKAMSIAIYHDGIMPTGKFDCGYMMEHIISHPIHVALMHDIDMHQLHGAKHNANFHVMFTRVVLDLKNDYRHVSS